MHPTGIIAKARETALEKPDSGEFVKKTPQELQGTDRGQRSSGTRLEPVSQFTQGQTQRRRPGECFERLSDAADDGERGHAERTSRGVLDIDNMCPAADRVQCFAGTANGHQQLRSGHKESQLSQLQSDRTPFNKKPCGFDGNRQGRWMCTVSGQTAGLRLEFGNGIIFDFGFNFDTLFGLVAVDFEFDVEVEIFSGFGFDIHAGFVFDLVFRGRHDDLDERSSI